MQPLRLWWRGHNRPSKSFEPPVRGYRPLRQIAIMRIGPGARGERGVGPGASMLRRVTRRNRWRQACALIARAPGRPRTPSGPIAKYRGGIIVAMCVVAAAIFMPGTARAAGAAYAVDTSEISAEGSCKVETWYSWASNADLVGIANPSCVVNVGRPVEFSA